MKSAPLEAFERSQLADERAEILARFRAVTGIALTSINVEVLPETVLDRAVPSPAELLSRPGLSRRTRNALERAAALDRGWRVADLMSLRGFGLNALVEVLESARPRPAALQSLDEELRTLLALRKRPAAGVVAPQLERAVALIAADLPASEAEIQRRFEADGLASGPVTLAEIERAARLLTAYPRFAVIRRPGLVVAVPAEASSHVQTALRMALRTLAHAGMVSLPDLCARFEEGFALMLRRILAAHGGFRWIDEARGWFSLEDALAAEPGSA